MAFTMRATVGTDSDVFSDAVRIRKTVFVQEQGVPLQLELDDKDAVAVHIVLYDKARPTPAGAARLRVLTHCGAHTHAKPVVKIERVCVLQEYRGKGCGTALIRALEAYARDMLHSPALILHARVNSKEFYTRLGYSAKSEVYMEAGKQHLTMAKL